METDRIDEVKIELFIQKAIAFAQSKEWGEAVESINAALKIKHTSKALLIKGKLLAQAGQYNQAIQVLEKISSDMPEYVEARPAIVKAKKIQNSRFKWLYIAPHRILFFFILTTVLLLFTTIIFMAMVFSDSRDQLLHENIASISAETVQLKENVTELNRVVNENRANQKEQYDHLLKTVNNQIEDISKTLTSSMDQEANLFMTYKIKMDSTEFYITQINKQLKNLRQELNLEYLDYKTDSEKLHKAIEAIKQELNHIKNLLSHVEKEF